MPTVQLNKWNTNNQPQRLFWFSLIMEKNTIITAQFPYFKCWARLACYVVKMWCLSWALTVFNNLKNYLTGGCFTNCNNIYISRATYTSTFRNKLLSNFLAVPGQYSSTQHVKPHLYPAYVLGYQTVSNSSVTS